MSRRIFLFNFKQTSDACGSCSFSRYEVMMQHLTSDHHDADDDDDGDVSYNNK